MCGSGRCRPGHCTDAPGAIEPALFDCPACDAEGCEECGGSGRLRLAECPLEYAPGDIWEAVEMAQMAENGILPLAGGMLDQTAKFVDAARFVWSETAHWRAEAMERDLRNV